MKILIIEDDLDLQTQLQKALSAEHYSSVVCSNGEEGLYLAEEYDFDLAIIDIGLPGMSGIEVTQTLRKAKSPLPILLLTARSSWKDKVVGLKAGADDYLAKPFQLEELLARMEAMIRRSGGYLSNDLERGPLRLNLETQELFVQGIPMDLTAFEHKLLEYFMRNPMRIVSKTTLMDYLYEEDLDRDSNVLEVMIGRLRRKIDPDSSLKPIETLRGRGYRFTIKE
jgi:two-component system, OmpR family, response regulator PhoP